VSMSVFAGGAERLDGALERVVGPVVADARGRHELTRWSFIRSVDGRGPHLRVQARVRSAAARQQLESEIRARLPLAHRQAVRESLLPRPVSQRRGGRRISAEPEGAVASQSAADELSSEVILDAMPVTRGGRRRVALALSLLRILGRLTPHGDRPELWLGLVRHWVGEDERGDRLFEHLGELAEEQGPRLREVADELEQGSAVPVLSRWRNGLQAVIEAGDLQEEVGYQAHLCCNRLGVTPLEEALVARMLATELEQAAPAAPPEAQAEPAAQPVQDSDRSEPRADNPPEPPRGRDDEPPATPSEARADSSERGQEDEPSETPVVEVRDVTKYDDDRPVLEEVSIEIQAGEVFAVLGPEAAGKSNLLGVVAGMRVASEGEVRVYGRDPQEDRRELAGRMAMPQFDEELSENGSVRGYLEQRGRGQDTATLDEVLLQAGLRHRAAAELGELDPGERRRLIIAAALLSDPDLLVLDEPTLELSAPQRESVWKLLQARRAAGTTMLLATSSLQDTLVLADRVGLIVAGAFASVREPEELASDLFPTRTVHFQTVAEPDLALISDLPEVEGVRADRRPDHWAVEVRAAQPDELLRVLGADPEFPEIVRITREDLTGTFAVPHRR